MYPAYHSFKSLRTKNADDSLQWLPYWICYSALELPDLLLQAWFPMYFEAKILLLLWLVSPYTQGAKYLYLSKLEPWLNANQDKLGDQLFQLASSAKDIRSEDIRSYLEKASSVALSAVGQLQVQDRSEVRPDWLGWKSGTEMHGLICVHGCRCQSPRRQTSRPRKPRWTRHRRRRRRQRRTRISDHNSAELSLGWLDHLRERGWLDHLRERGIYDGDRRVERLHQPHDRKKPTSSLRMGIACWVLCCFAQIDR